MPGTIHTLIGKVPIHWQHVAVALALQEFDKMKALDGPQDAAVLMERLQARDGDFNLLAGVVGAYLNERGLIGECE